MTHSLTCWGVCREFVEATWLINTWLPLFLYERFHLSLSGAGFSATFYLQGMSYAGVILGGFAADRWARLNPRARLWMQALGLAVGAPFLALVAFGNSLGVVIAALCAFGLGRGVFDCNTMPVLREVVGAGKAATGYGLLNMAGCVSGGLAVAAAGYLKQLLGLATPFACATAMLVFSALALLAVPGPTQPALPPTSE